ncbi:MAG: Smr/MutS family endonuclease [Motiliproteus sp.]|nr:Smr/MutS family endonuclease [Motiliproteus sp.]MCW9051119.1 Smr/MutS family endonuclease [Motiliproteus sp.]
MADPTTDDDIDFQAMMGDVTPIKHDRADIKRPTRKQSDADYRRAAAITNVEKFDQGLSDELRTLVDSEEELIYAQPGIQLRMMRKLKKGQIPWQEGIDLHGYTVDQAREELGRFIRQTSHRGLRSVIVVHGKALNEDGTPAILKSYTNDWLQQMHQVLAFVSALPQDGGTGALYVLLKKPQSSSQ